jgi:hypothetical protein
MDPTTRKALNGSIKKWRKIVAGTGIDLGDRNCPLCALFNSMSNPGGSCTGCPVKEKTGEPWCRGTPYGAWGRTKAASTESKITTDSERRLAQRELDFLISLRAAG